MPAIRLVTVSGSRGTGLKKSDRRRTGLSAVFRLKNPKGATGALCFWASK